MMKRLVIAASSVVIACAVSFGTTHDVRGAEPEYQIAPASFFGTGVSYTAWNAFSGTSPWVTPPAVESCSSGLLSNIDLAWGDGPLWGCSDENVIVKFSGLIVVPDSGPLSFCISSDDGFYLKIGGTMIISDWTGHPTSPCYNWGSGSRYGTYSFMAGRAVPFEAWYFEASGGASVSLQFMIPAAPEDDFNCGTLDATVCPTITDAGTNLVTGAPGSDYTTARATYAWLRCRDAGDALESRRIPTRCRVIRSTRSTADRMANAPYRITAGDRSWGYLRLSIIVGRTTYYSGAYDLNQ